MILLARLKFCLRVLNSAGAVFEVKVVPANNLRQQNFAGAEPENTNTVVSVCVCVCVMLKLRPEQVV